MDTGEPYLPVGDLPYVLRRTWGDVAVPLVPLTGSVLLWLAGLDPLSGTILVLFSLFLLCGVVLGTARSGDEAGVVFAVDEQGIYFGDVPREHIPWPMVKTVWMSEWEPKNDHDSGREFWVRVAPPSDLGAETRRVRHGDFYPDFAEVGDALERYAPPHVLVRLSQNRD